MDREWGTLFFRGNDRFSCGVTGFWSYRCGFVPDVNCFNHKRKLSVLTLEPGGGYALPGLQGSNVGRVRGSRHPTQSAARSHHLVPTREILKRRIPHVHQAGEGEDKNDAWLEAVLALIVNFIKNDIPFGVLK